MKNVEKIYKGQTFNVNGGTLEVIDGNSNYIEFNFMDFDENKEYRRLTAAELAAEVKDTDGQNHNFAFTKVYRIETSTGDTLDQCGEFFGDDDLEKIEADSAKDAAKYVDADCFDRNTWLAVTELIFDEFSSELEPTGDTEYFYLADV